MDREVKYISSCECRWKRAKNTTLEESGFLNKQAGVLHVEGPVLTGRGAVHFRSAKSEDPAPPQKLFLLDPRPALAPEPHCQ